MAAKVTPGASRRVTCGRNPVGAASCAHRGAGGRGPSKAAATTGTHPQQPTGGELNSAIANAVVRIHRDHAGRGPATAHAFYRHNIVVVMVGDAMTTGEHSLVAAGNLATAVQMRREFQEAMRADLVVAVEELTGCVVVALLSDNHIDPDLGVEVFVLDRWVSGPPAA